MSMKSLREAVKKSNRDEFASGTVVRWVASGTFTYVAVKTPVGWFTSSRGGNPYVPQVLTFDDLLEILSLSETSHVAVAVTWEYLCDNEPDFD